MPERKAARKAKHELRVTKFEIWKEGSIKILRIAPRETGIKSKNEKRIASSLERPAKIPPEIEEPEREMPGIKAKDWKIPTKNPFAGVTPPFFPSIESAKNIKILPAISAQATEWGFLKISSILSPKKNPKNPAGIEPKTTAHKIFVLLEEKP